MTKYEDPNFNGEADAGEDTLSGWEFQLKDGDGNAIGGPELTDGNGSILYIVQPGNYSVCETETALTRTRLATGRRSRPG